MKLIFLIAFLPLSVFAQMPTLPTSSEAMKNYAKYAMEACKEDKSKIEGCESYSEIKPLKECLMKNESQLSDQCKTSLKLVK